MFDVKCEQAQEYVGQDLGTMERVPLFIMDWRHHPNKDDRWYEQRYKEAERTGMLHILKREIDRDTTAQKESTLIKREWVKAAVNLHKELPELLDGGLCGGLDIADGGQDFNAIVIRKGLTIVNAASWVASDTAHTARKALTMAELSMQQFKHKLFSLYYDSIGVGSGVKAETNRLRDSGDLLNGVSIYAWNAAASPEYPDKRVEPKDKQTPLNKDYFANLKAQGWWSLRRRFEKTYRYREFGEAYNVNELISLEEIKDKDIFNQLTKELCQVKIKETPTMKLVIDKAPKGIRSPNIADAAMMCCFPLKGASPYTTSLENIS